MDEPVGIVLVNWRGARDTIACLASLERLEPRRAPLCVVVVDNDSGDDSVETIRSAMLERGYAAVEPPSARPADPRIGGVEWFTSGAVGPPVSIRLALVRNHRNLGFAAACNIGHVICRSACGCDFVWMLNNDTEVTPPTLRLLLDRMRRQPDLGICGCTCVYFSDPGTIQCSGGVHYSVVTGRGRVLGSGVPLEDRPDNATIESQFTFVYGASMFLRCSLIDRIGPMSEAYFLYNEEIDWAWRARGHFRLGVETTAVILHKEGASIGTAGVRRRPSPLANFFQTRSKLLFARRFTPWFLPTVWLVLLLRFLKLFVQGERATSVVILQVLFGRRQPDPRWFQRTAAE